MKRVAAIAVIHDHHMLMGKRRDNQRWTNPGGHLDAGEDPLKGAVREVKEETGLELDPHQFKHLETRIVKKPDGERIEVHGFRVDLREKPPTSMREDPDQEVERWQWIKTDTDLEHLKGNLHVPLGDNVLLDNILKDKPMKKHVRRFWDDSRRVGLRALREGSEQYAKRSDSEKEASMEGPRQAQRFIEELNAKLGQKEKLVGGKADGMPDSAFPKDQLRMGIKVEREHSKDPAIAREATKDHLTEDKKYYTHLKEMEDKYVEKKAFWNGFEKRAISSDLLRRAEGKAEQQMLHLAEIVDQNMYGTPKYNLLCKRTRQRLKFDNAATAKEKLEGKISKYDTDLTR